MHYQTSGVGLLLRIGALGEHLFRYTTKIYYYYVAPCEHSISVVHIHYVENLDQKTERYRLNMHNSIYYNIIL